jgi:hypothetical protein
VPTPSIVPDNDGEGLIGTADKRWSGAYFKGHVNSRGQDVLLKYFVADAATRYALTGLGPDFRPSQGDLVFQYSPTGLFLVLDETLLSNDSGYRPIGQTPTELLTNPAIYDPTIYGRITVPSGVTGKILYLDSGSSIAYSNVNASLLDYMSGLTGNIQSQINGMGTGFAPLNSPVFISGITTPYIIVTGETVSSVPYFDSTGRLTSSNVLITEMNQLSGASGNIQSQINSLRSGRISRWGVQTLGTSTGNIISGDALFSGGGNISITLSGQTILISGNTGMLSSYVTTGSTGSFITTGHTGQFVTTGATGSLTGAFYPRSLNPSNYVTSGNTGSFIDRNILHNAFLDVSMGSGVGSEANYTLTSFNLIPFDTINSDTGGHWNTTGFYYTVPVNGIYQIVTKVRVTDGQTPGDSYGFGADIQGNGDSPYFLWAVTAPNRNGAVNVRTSHFNAGDLINAIAFSDSSDTGSDASMQITLLIPD